MPLKMIGIKKVTGGAVTDSQLVQGVAFKKTFSYAGFEQQPKSFTNPKVLLLHLELELKAEKDNAEVRLSNPDEYQSIVDAEWRIIYEKLEKIAESGAQVILSRLAIGDLATQYFADRGIFCAGRVEGDDLERTSLAVGAPVQTTVNGLTSDVLTLSWTAHTDATGNYETKPSAFCEENIQISSLSDIAMEGHMRSPKLHLCYNKCIAQDCEGDDCFCGGAYTGYDTASSNALCADEDLCQHLCDSYEDCMSIDMAKDKPRCFLNVDDCD